MLSKLTATVLFLSSISSLSIAPVDPHIGRPGQPLPNKISLLHTNDIHAHIDQYNKYGTDCTPQQISENKCMGGVARLKTIIDRTRKSKPDTLLFDAGDQFQGTMFYTYYKGNVTANVMNELKYDLMTVGNHEFDDGPEHLAKFFNKLNFPVVCANMDLSRNAALRQVVKPYKLFPHLQVAVMGFITNTTGFISSAGPTVGFKDPVPVIQKVVNELKARGYKRIIAVSHNGYKEDQDVARRTKGLDLIVGGHSHTYLSIKPNEPGSGGLYPTKVINLDGEPTYVVQAYRWGNYIGSLDLTFDNKGVISKIEGEPILMDSTIPLEPSMEKMVSEWRKPFDEFGKVVVGESAENFSNSGCQSGECAIGDLLTDAMVAARQGQVRGAIMNAGGIRSGFAQGPIRVSDVLAMLPFGNALIDINLTGAQLRQLFEDIFSKQNKESGKPVTSFVQIAGLRVKYNPKADAWKKVVSLEIDDGKGGFEVVKDDVKYPLVTIDFLATGGDGFFAKAPGPLISLIGIDVALKEYVTKNTPVSVKASSMGRITTV